MKSRVSTLLVCFILTMSLLVGCRAQPTENKNNALPHPSPTSPTPPKTPSEFERQAAASNLAEAKKISSNKKATTLDLAKAKLLLESIPDIAPESKEAKRLHKSVHDRQMRMIEKQIRAESSQKGKESRRMSSMYFENPGVHRLPNGRIYSVAMRRSGELTIYDYTGAISGQVIVDRQGTVTYDTRVYK